ncbi:hypothetical protein [Sphingopyxis fribergensis]
MNNSLGKILAMIAGLIPLVYIAWLLLHFIGVGGGSMKGIVGIGLAPTVIGLSFVGLLFALPFIIKLLRVTTGVNRVPGKSFDAKAKAGEASDEPSFDADAAFASYMRKREQSGEAPPVDTMAANPADDRESTPVRSAGFGRKGLG